MKKIFALVLALAMVFALCACGSSATTTTAPAAETKTETATETTEAAAPSVKFGLITLHDENSTYDANFINAAHEAVEALKAEGIDVDLIIKSGVSEGQDCYEAAADFADQGCDIIMADSFGHEPYMLQAAKEYPEVEFLHATGTTAHTAGVENFHNAFASIYEGRYLAGVVAGLKLQEMIDNGEISAEEVKVGYVGAFTYAEVISGYTSWFLGVRSIVPNATMEVTFTGSWYDEAAEKEGAQALINDGCVLVSQHADSMGAPTACETAGVPNVSYNGSTAESCPNTFLVSSRINWAPYIVYAVKAFLNGEAISYDYIGTIETGSVVLTDLGTAVADGTAEYLDGVKAKLASGELHVFDCSTFTVNGETLESYEADVDSDANFEKDTNVIVDGYFAESAEGFRSAPYFDIQIDGISLLNTKF